MSWNILYDILRNSDYFVDNDGLWDSKKFNQFIDDLKNENIREFLEDFFKDVNYHELAKNPMYLIRYFNKLLKKKKELEGGK